MNLYEQMSANPNVRVKPLEDVPGVYACNFTRDTFWKGLWDAGTVTARGLFVTAGGEVVARGYSKFFNLGEPHGYADLDDYLSACRDHGATSLDASVKHNGFLAIVAGLAQQVGEQEWDHQGAELLVFSKSGPTDFGELARTALVDQVGAERAGALARALSFYGVSLTLEVTSPKDPHLTDEQQDRVGDRVVLLDAIANDATMRLDDDFCGYVSREFGLVRRASHTVDLTDPVAARQRLLELFEGCEAARGEGMVLRATGADGEVLMCKYKSRYYRAAKRLRTILKQRVAGKVPTRQQLAGMGALDRALHQLVDERDLDVVAVLTTFTSVQGREETDVVAMLRDEDLAHELGRIADELADTEVLVED